MKDDAVATTRFLWYGSLFVAFAVLVSFLWWKFYYPVQLDNERNAIQHSHQYTDSKRSMLLKMAEEYEASDADIAKYRASDPEKFKDVIKGMETQQEVLLARIRSEAKMIPADQVPDSVRKYLR